MAGAMGVAVDEVAVAVVATETGERMEGIAAVVAEVVEDTAADEEIAAGAEATVAAMQREGAEVSNLENFSVSKEKTKIYVLVFVQFKITQVRSTYDKCVRVSNEFYSFYLKSLGTNIIMYHLCVLFKQRLSRKTK